MRKVFDNAMVAHVWAQQEQDEGRSGNGNFYFSGPTIYSYGSHFPIATFTRDAHGERCVLFTTGDYSVSTARHITYTSRALDGLNVKVWNVPLLRSSRYGAPDEATHAANAKLLADEAVAHAADLANVRKRSRFYNEGSLPELEFRQRHAARIADEVIAYCEAFAVAIPDNVNAVQWQQSIRDAFAKYHDPAAVAKREKAAAQRAARRDREEAALLQRYFAVVEGVLPSLSHEEYKRLDWQRAHDYRNLMQARNPTRIKYGPDYLTAEQWRDGKPGTAHPAIAYTLVRRRGDQLETSRHATCPFKHAVLAFMKAQECKRLGIEWRRNGHSIHVGHFQVDHIDAQGNLRAGCHTLLFEEMMILAVREVPHLVQPTYALPVAA
jgi:hypothetical protein